MTEEFRIDDFENPPLPPKYLYKYLSAERIGNVLEGGTVRFTPLINTNDSFEVRSTFHKIAGPRFLQMLAEQLDIAASESAIDDKIATELRESGLSGLPVDAVKEMFEQHYGGNLRASIRAQIQVITDTMLVPFLNDPKRADELLDRMGRRLMCFSLSERFDSPPMWAHYADNHAGFIVAFNTEHDWFRHRKGGSKKRLLKITYFDGKVEELLENVQAAFLSKTTDWAYEREWRIYASEEEIERTVGSADDPVHLLDFPPEAVERVIVGSKASEETVAQIRDALNAGYPGAELFRAIPNRSTHTYDLERI